MATFQSKAGDSLDKRMLRLCVSLAVEWVLLSQSSLQRLVFNPDAAMLSKVVTKCDWPQPLRTSKRHEMKMMSAKRRRGLTEPMFQV